MTSYRPPVMHRSISLQRAVPIRLSAASPALPNGETSMNTAVTNTLEYGQAAASQTFERTLSSLKDGVAQATAGREQAQATIRTNVEKTMKTTEEMISFGQGNFEAASRAS